MASEETHKLVLVKKYETGAEEWYCPSCGRHFVMQWDPEYQRVIFVSGDETVVHNTSRGDIIVYRPQVDDPYLTPWLEWMEKDNFEGRWNE